MSFSYSSMQMGIRKRINELHNLYRGKSNVIHNLPESVNIRIKRLQRVEQAVFKHTGIKTTGLKVLEIGSGQTCFSMLYFASKENNVIGVDLDEIVHGFNILGYYRMWRKNGILRVIKTLGRKAIGIDRKLELELTKQLNTPLLAKPKVLTMDASNMTFPEASFDFVFSNSVFEHLSEPSKVIEEIIRVLKPGGCAYLSTHIYTSDSGCHDPRIFSKNRSNIPFWSHLRSQHAAKVQPNAYLNKIRMSEWKQLFLAKMPEVVFEHLKPDKERLKELQSELIGIRQKGELQEYTDDELLTTSIVAIWTKGNKTV